MSTTQFIESPPIKDFFCDSFERCNLATGLKPTQVMGLIPCKEDDGNCRPDPCMVFKAFADATGNSYNNDTSHFLFDFPTDAGNDYKLERWDGSTWSYVRDLDNSTGVLFDFGSFPDYPKRSGVLIDWSIILSDNGQGVYRLSLEGLFGSPSPELVSLPIDLMEFSCECANNTVRVKTSFSGIIANILYDDGSTNPRRFDLDKMRWDDEIRVYGNFVDIPSTREQTEYVDGTDRSQQHGIKTIKKYQLIMNAVIQEIIDRFDVYASGADAVKVSNYVDTNSAHYDDKGVTINDDTMQYEWSRSMQIPVAICTLSNRYIFGFDRC